MKYLIVDDHPMTRKTVIDSLRQPGDAFAEAGTGEEAIEHCARHTPDWVIMDVKMPGCGGMFASQQILSRHPHLRIVIFSQYVDDAMAAAARAAGGLDFISKDRIAELPEILHELAHPSTRQTPTV